MNIIRSAASAIRHDNLLLKDNLQAKHNSLWRQCQFFVFICVYFAMINHYK